MGSTVTTNKLISAFRGKDGHPCYVMFEETYEKNVHPHTPHWSAWAIGGVEAMMKRIFSVASACEGGMLQGRGGRQLTPEGYISGWLKELANPVAMPDLAIDMRVSASWNAHITAEDLQALKPAMLAAGYETLVSALEAGESGAVSLHADSGLLSSIYDGQIKSAWRVIPAYSVPLYAHRDESLGWSPKKVKGFEVFTPRCLRVSERNENILFQQPDGRWRCEGWAYRVVGDYVTDLWEAEMREPGSYRQRIKAFRDAVAAAKMVSLPGPIVVIDQSLPVEKYQQRSVQALLAKVSPTVLGNELSFQVPTDEDILYSVTALPVGNTRWVIPERALPVTPTQLGLFAA